MGLLRPVDLAFREQAVVQNMVDMEMRVDNHSDIAGVKAPFFQGFEKAIGLVRHAGIDDDVMMVPREQRAGGASPTAGKEYLRLPCGLLHGRIGGLQIGLV